MRIRSLGALVGFASCLLLAGCFEPAIQSGGFACDQRQTPACPTGFYCVNQRCVDHVGAGTVLGADLATANPGTGGVGDAPDLQAPPATPDFSVDPPAQDLSQPVAPDDLSQPPPPDLAQSNNCAHSLCTSGATLTSGCDPCVTQICAVDNYCCVTKWSSICVKEVTSICGRSCP
jgi:hypothetical protein